MPAEYDQTHLAPQNRIATRDCIRSCVSERDKKTGKKINTQQRFDHSTITNASICRGRLIERGILLLQRGFFNYYSRYAGKYHAESGILLRGSRSQCFPRSHYLRLFSTGLLEIVQIEHIRCWQKVHAIGWPGVRFRSQAVVLVYALNLVSVDKSDERSYG